MKTALLAALILIAGFTTQAQVISQFTWNSAPLTTAAVGPNAISVSSSATSSSGGVGGTNGLNPGTPTADVNLTITGSPTFDVQGIDIFVNFRREENDASFFTRGTSLDFGMAAGSLFADFKVSNGAGGSVSVSSGAVFAIPDDHTFHSYHFRYDPNTGQAKIWFDGSLKYTYSGTAARTMYWTGSGNVVVGKNMDATGRNITVLDNLSISNVALTLPLDLLSFDAIRKGELVSTSWSTAHETNVANIAVERSADGIHFNTIKNIKPFNSNSGITTNYQYTDSTPFYPMDYYRLKITDIDGEYKYSSIKVVSFNSTIGASVEMSCYPNPATDYVNLRINSPDAAIYSCTVTTLDGRTLQSKSIQVTKGVQMINVDLRNIVAQNFLVVNLRDTQNNTHQSFKIFKR